MCHGFDNLRMGVITEIFQARLLPIFTTSSSNLLPFLNYNDIIVVGKAYRVPDLEVSY